MENEEWNLRKPTDSYLWVSWLIAQSESALPIVPDFLVTRNRGDVPDTTIAKDLQWCASRYSANGCESRYEWSRAHK